MNSQKERAFPRPIGNDNLQYYNSAQAGMSLLDYFAGQALIGLIINDKTVSADVPLTARAYEIANAMMASRKEWI
jgi:hypothetical protein